MSLDPRVKLVLALAWTAWVGLLPRGREGLLAVLVLGLLLLARLAQRSTATLVFRASAALPFVLIPLLLQLLTGRLDLAGVAAMACRAGAAAMVVALLIDLTPFPAILAAAAALGMPELMVGTTALAWRYMRLLRTRGAAMAASARARGYGAASPQRLAVAGNMLGALLLRSLDRAERVHRAMLARGYSGRMPSAQLMAMRRVDWLTGGLGLSLALGSLAWLR